MKYLVERWRQFINKEVDPDIITHISWAIEENLEMGIKKIYVGDDRYHIRVLLDLTLEEHAPQLMDLIQERWETSRQREELKYLG